MKNILYFAYGSNLWSTQMRKRCPGSAYVAVASLPEHRIIFDGYDNGRAGAVANTVPSNKDMVWGVLYSLTPRDLKLLDGYEDYPIDYQRKSVMVYLENGEKVEAVLYFRPQQQIGAPSKEYAKIIIDGAREHHLPQSYIDTYLKPMTNEAS